MDRLLSPQHGLRLGLLGVAEPGPEHLERIVCRILGAPRVRIDRATADPVDYDFASIATGGLFRVAGTATLPDGQTVPWSSFVKLLHAFRHWRLASVMPPTVAEEMSREFPWKAELETREQVLSVLPPGLRVPDVYDVVDLDDDRLAVWMENVDVDPTPWTPDVHATCAHRLARLAARRTPDRAAGRSAFPPGYSVRKLVEGRLHDLTARVADDAYWSGELVAAHVDPRYRRDLGRTLARLPGILEQFDRLPQSLHHGDATSANLLVPRGEPDTFVAIDWSFNTPLAVGHDLGQLLVGEVQDGRGDAALLGQVHAAIVPAYLDGLADEGLAVPREVVDYGYIGGLACRTVGTALPPELDGLPATPERHATMAQRAAMGRFVLDLVDTLPDRAPATDSVAC